MLLVPADPHKEPPMLTSTSGPMVAANASGESVPKFAMATAIANSYAAVIFMNAYEGVV